MQNNEARKSTPTEFTRNMRTVAFLIVLIFGVPALLALSLYNW